MKFVKIKPYYALPCEAEVFEIKGQRANKSDFGRQGNVRDFEHEYGPLDDENWACCDNQFTPFEEVNQEVLDKYGISEQEYRDVQDHLVQEFNIGSCGWCV